MQNTRKNIEISSLQQKGMYFFIAMALALFTTVALLAKGNMPTTDEALAVLNVNHWIVIGFVKLYLSLNTSNIAASIIFVGIGYYYYNSISKLSADNIVVVLSCAFSLFMVLGFSYHKYDSWDYIFSNRFQFVFGLIQVIGWNIFFYFTLHHLFRIVDTKRKQTRRILILICEK